MNAMKSKALFQALGTARRKAVSVVDGVTQIDAYQDLANAIVVQAAEDYRDALKRLKAYPDDEKAKWVKDDVENFFGSTYYRFLTKADPQYILKKIREEVAADEV